MDLKKINTNRANVLRWVGIKHVCLVNHRGGKSLFKMIGQPGSELTDENIIIHGLNTYQFNDLMAADAFYGVSFRACRCGLEQKEGNLIVRLSGILHSNLQKLKRDGVRVVFSCLLLISCGKV